MQFERMVDKKNVNLNMSAKSKYDAIRKMGQMLYDTGRIKSIDKFIEDVFKREEVETTNMDIGVAIPHSQANVIKRTSISIVKLSKEISWEDYGEPVKIIFLIAVSPTDKGIKHLEVISKIAEILIDDKFIQFLKKTRNSRKLLKRMNKLIGG